MKKLMVLPIILLSILLVVSAIACGSKGSSTVIPTVHLTTRVMQGQGEVYPSSGDYPLGTQITITAVPADGWVFAGWGSCMEEEWPDNTYTMTLQWNESVAEACFIQEGSTYNPTPTP